MTSVAGEQGEGSVIEFMVCTIHHVLWNFLCSLFAFLLVLIVGGFIQVSGRCFY